MPRRLLPTEATVAVLFVSVTAFPFFFPNHSIAEPASINSGTPALVQDDDEDIDANLVPLEPELTAIPPDLSSTEEATDKKAETVAEQLPAADNSDSTSSDSTTQTSYAGLATGPNGTSYNIPVIVDPVVESHIRFFNTSIRSRFEQWLIRFSRYRPMVENIFAEFNLPSDLVNLSLVESGFNPYAYSRAKATGPWQFMQGTGKVYGLRIDHYVDERRDPIKSTVAAARYLRDLYDLFGTWPLAMAAYNAGEGKVQRALHKAQGKTFWDISKTRLIRRETKDYVPRIMAATIIARNPDQYGFSPAVVPPHEFEEVIVNRALHFRAIASASGIAYEELRLLNPELRRDATPPDDPAYHLKVPVGTAEKVADMLDRIPTYKFPPLVSKVRHAKAGTRQSYRVRPGDTLEKVSKRFNVPVRTLKTRNNLSSSVIRPGEFLTISR